MTPQSQQELATLVFFGLFAAFVFWETMEFAGAASAQTSPGAFPRLAACTIGVMVAIRAFLLISRVVQPSHPGEGRWPWATVRRPLGAAILMAFYTAAFETVPFTPLTLMFVFSAFLIFGVRPWKRLLVSTVIATGFLYLLFVQLLNVGV